MNFPSDSPNKSGRSLLGVSDVADRLNCTTTTIYKWISEGKFPQSIKLGNRHRWRPSDIENWIDAGGTDSRERGQG